MSTPPKASTGSVAKRVLVGRAFTSANLEHTLLPKVLALPVFASDALSSVAYASGEILLALTIATTTPAKYVMPISFAIAALMAIVVSSYRQTVRAYPGGGGAYIVSKENLGVFAGLVAAAALLFDYMMTVVVSIVAGVFAIGSAFPWANQHRVLLSVFFVALITLANLRGTKESGRVFAIPTYGFVLSILVLIAVGVAKCLGGCPAVSPVPHQIETATAVAGITIFALLKAFSQGATALTGVEAISNGVPAFKRPQARNAATTLAIMGTIAVTMFLGISYLVTHVHGVVASQDQSAVAQIANAVFGNSSIGFYIVQAFTAAILVLAANTAYQDFPRLASILGRDRYMPSQFVNRGDRLVFSNGVIVLGVLASLMIYAFDADLDRLIHFYVVGVFTSFTLSQSGMVRHWITEGRKGAGAMKGWRRSIVINIIGAVTTFIVLIVVIVSKFRDGAWLSILIMALLVPVFYAIHRHYTWVRSVVHRGVERVGVVGTNHVVLLVRDVDASAAEALGYIRSLRPQSLSVITPGEEVPQALVQAWAAFAGQGVPALTPLGAGSLTTSVRRFVAGIDLAPHDVVTLVVPEMVGEHLSSHVVRTKDIVRLKAAMLRIPRVVVTDVPVVTLHDGARGVEAKPLIPNRTATLVFLSGVNDLTIRAVNYAKSLDASTTRAIYFDLDPEAAHRLESEWFDAGFEIPLDIVEAPFRDLTGPMLEEVRRFSSDPGTVV
ncbi:MAG: APC family permease, partial [Actinomycetota bacterium]